MQQIHPTMDNNGGGETQQSCGSDCIWAQFFGKDSESARRQEKSAKWLKENEGEITEFVEKAKEAVKEISRTWDRLNIERPEEFPQYPKQVPKDDGRLYVNTGATYILSLDQEDRKSAEEICKVFAKNLNGPGGAYAVYMTMEIDSAPWYASMIMNKGKAETPTIRLVLHYMTAKVVI